jgi:tetratricopeptide (TPR) repeat protein
MPNKLSQIWQELKRRNVVRVITVYAGAAFVIIELINNISEPLRLPDWTPTLIIVLLAIGFPIVIIFSWIYDVRPKGEVFKTKPADNVEVEDIPKSSNSWKIASYISFVVIVVMVCILLYPKIFKQDRFSRLRNDEGIITLAVLPFDNHTGDSSLYFWQNGISEYLINRLGGSQELAVSSSQVISDVLEGTLQINAASLSPDIARRTARKINASTYATGNFIGKESDAVIMLNLVNTESGELIWTTSVDGDLERNYREVLGSLADTVRNYMEIKALEAKVETDYSNAYPNSAEAYRYYIDGLNAIVASNYESAIESLKRAYEIDTTFTFAAFYLAFTYNFGKTDLLEEATKWIDRAYELKNNLPPAYHPWIELWKACDGEDINEIRRCCNLLDEAVFHSRFLLLDLGVTYSGYLEDYDKSIQAYERLEALNRRWDDDWKYNRYYREYAWTLLKVDRPEDAIRIARTGLGINPGDAWLKLYQCSGELMAGDSIAAKTSLSDFRAVIEEYNLSESAKERFIGLMYLFAKDTLMTIKHYRHAYSLEPGNLNRNIILARILVESGVDIEEGLAVSENGLDLYPDDFQLLLWKGVALYKQGKHNESLSVLYKADSVCPVFNPIIKKHLRLVEQTTTSQNL